MATNAPLNPYRQTDPREGMRQAMLIQQKESSRLTRVEWIPSRFKVGSDVAVSGIAGRWKVAEIYNPTGRK